MCGLCFFRGLRGFLGADLNELRLWGGNRLVTDCLDSVKLIHSDSMIRYTNDCVSIGLN